MMHEENNNFIIVTEKCMFVEIEKDSSGSWTEATLFVVHNGNGLGLIYNKNEWIDDAPVEHEILLPCQWDHIDILNTPYGDFAVTYSKGKCGCLSLQAQCTKTDEISKEDDYFICISATPICENQYTSIISDEKCQRIIIFEKDYKKQYYDLENKTTSRLYDWICGINTDCIACYQNNQVQCINIFKGITLPTPENFEVIYKCEYLDGAVFLIYNHDMDNPSPQEYLLFYSEPLNCFYKTEMFEKINIFGITSTIFPFEMSGFEGIAESRDITYHALGNYWSDKDIKKANCICVCENEENKPNTHKIIDLGLCGTQHVE